MIYFILSLLAVASITANIMLYWYIRNLLSKYWFDTVARQRFMQMIGQYAESLESLYKLEEFYGEEIIKKAVVQTQFVIEACKEFKEAIENEVIPQEDNEEQSSYEDQENSPQVDEKNGIIRLREGQKVSQDASNYKRVVNSED